MNNILTILPHDKTYTFSVFILKVMLINLIKDISAATNVDAAFKTFSKNFNLPIWFSFPFLFSQYHLIIHKGIPIKIHTLKSITFKPCDHSLTVKITCMIRIIQPVFFFHLAFLQKHPL